MQKNQTIELHDSIIEEIIQQDNVLVVSFSHLYVHRSKGNPGFDIGTGWSQRGELTFPNSVDKLLR